jgi:HAD superfamily hydrolase (TIGR01509 family)
MGCEVMSISQGALKPSVFLSKSGQEIAAVLFDMDGVLADSVPLHVSAWNSALQEYGLPLLDRGAYLTALGRTNLDMIGKFLGRHDRELPLSSRKEIVATKERLFRGLIKDEMRIMPGVIDWLEFLREKHIRCSVASSGEMANIVAVLDALHLSDYFLSVLSGARLPASKPDPTLFTLAAASLGARVDRCLVVEDAPAGIQAAKAANMLCCALSTTCSPDELRQADFLLENLAQAAPASFFTDGLP